MQVEILVHSGIHTRLVVFTLITKLGRVFRHIFFDEFASSAHARNRLRRGRVVEPAHNIHIMATLGKQKTRAAAVFAVPFSAVVRREIMLTANMLVHFHRHYFSDNAAV